MTKASEILTTMTAAKRPKPIIEHSRDRIGQIWRAEDHAYMERTLRQVDALAQALTQKARR